MISRDRLNDRRDPSALDSLEVENCSLVQVVELRMMPVGLCVAEVLARVPSIALFALINNCWSAWDIILNVLQWEIKLQVVLLRSLLGCSISWR